MTTARQGDSSYGQGTVATEFAVDESESQKIRDDLMTAITEFPTFDRRVLTVVATQAVREG